MHIHPYIMGWNDGTAGKLGLSNFNNKALKINTITIGLWRRRRQESAPQTEIARRKSAVENPPLYRQKNEVAEIGGKRRGRMGGVRGGGGGGGRRECDKGVRGNGVLFARQGKSEETHFGRSL